MQQSAPQEQSCGAFLCCEKCESKGMVLFDSRPHPFPSPAGEGAANRGGRRGRTRRDRDVKMTAAVGVCERFYRLPAVTFSLFRHPPRGGSADATFPRWGKEMAAADSPEVTACPWRRCRDVGTPPPTMKRCGFAGTLSYRKLLLRDAWDDVPCEISVKKLSLQHI